MCGIAYKHNFDGTPVNNDILQQFDKQRARGVQGFGLFDGQYMNMIRSASEDKILKWLVKYNSNLIMFHHRYPTSTVNVKRAAHPLSTHDYFGKIQYVLVHNGVIRNAKDLHVEHEKLGIKYHTTLSDGTYNDSESLLWDLTLTLEGKQKKMTAIGDMAFVMLKSVDGKLDKLIFGRKGRPLMMWRDKNTVELSSEGRGEEVEVDRLHTWSYKTKRLSSKAMEFKQYLPYVPHTSGIYGNGNTCGYLGPRSWTPQDYEDEYYDEYGHYPDHYSRFDEDDYEIHDYGKTSSKTGDKPKTNSQTWLGPALRKKFQKYLTDGTIKIGKPATIYTANDDGTFSEEALDSILERYEPSATSTESKALEYLIACNGCFEQAYWAMEMDYEDIVNAEDTVPNIRAKLELEAAMEFIELDPEYQDENSISSIWSTAWNHQQTLTA